jgi:hypothetical protein
LSTITPRHDNAPFIDAPVSKRIARTAIPAALCGNKITQIKPSQPFPPQRPIRAAAKGTAATIPAQMISCSRKALAQKEARQRETKIGYR